MDSGRCRVVQCHIVLFPSSWIRPDPHKFNRFDDIRKTRSQTKHTVPYTIHIRSSSGWTRTRSMSHSLFCNGGCGGCRIKVFFGCWKARRQFLRNIQFFGSVMSIVDGAARQSTECPRIKKMMELEIRRSRVKRW